MLKQFRSTPQKLVNSNFNEKKIEDLIKNQEAVLNNSTTLNERLNMLYNIINMRQSIGDSNHNYRDIKDLINTYINLIQTSDYGYDTFNYDKLEKVISKLTYKEQISILNYSLSILAREYPEYEKDWFWHRP